MHSLPRWREHRGWWKADLPADGKIIFLPFQKGTKLGRKSRILCFKAKKVSIFWKSVTHCKIEDENIGGVPHGLVEQNHQNHKKVSNKTDNYDEGEEDRHDDGHNGHQSLELLLIHHLLLLHLRHDCSIHLVTFISLQCFWKCWQHVKLGFRQQGSDFSHKVVPKVAFFTKMPQVTRPKKV